MITERINCAGCKDKVIFILVLIRFAKAKLFRTSYTVQKTKNIFANLFSVGIVYSENIVKSGNFNYSTIFKPALNVMNQKNIYYLKKTSTFSCNFSKITIIEIIRKFNSNNSSLSFYKMQIIKDFSLLLEMTKQYCILSF